MKKRLLAVVLSLAMVLSFLPFSVAAADTDYSSGLNDTASYAMKVPAVGNYAVGGNTHSTSNSAAVSVREENGEKFWVYDSSVFQETNIRTFTRGSKLTYNTTVGVPFDMSNMKYLAMRIKINDLNPAGVYQNSRFQVGIGAGTGSAWKEFLRIDKSSTNDSPNLFFSLEDYSLLPVHSDAGTNNHFGIETVGSIDGYLLLPLSHDTTGTLTAEYLANYYRTIAIDFLDYESSGNRQKYSNWDNKEFLLGDCFFVEDANAFAAARTPEGAEKYAVEGGYYALRAGAFRSYQYYANLYENAGAYGQKDMFLAKSIVDPTAMVTDNNDVYRGIHMTTLSDGSRALAFIPNVDESGATMPREINRFYLYVHDTYENSLNANAGQRNRPDKRIAGCPIDLTDVNALAIRLAVKNPNANSLRIQTIFYNVGAQPAKDSVAQFVDVKTGAVTEYAYDGNAFPITATEFDGYVIIPLDTLNKTPEQFKSSKGSWDRIQFNLLSGYDATETYLGDVFFVEDTETFLNARTGCGINGHTKGEAVKENVVESTLNSAGSYNEVVRCTVCGEILSSKTVTTKQLTGAKAEIDGYYYATLEEAIAAAEAGDTIYLKGDIEVTDVAYKISKDLTLNLNGYTLSGVATTATTNYLINVNAGVTFKIEGEGTISFRATTPDTEWGEGYVSAFPGYANNTINVSGTLIVEDATIENWTAKGGASYVICTYANSSLVINSGTIAQRGGDIAIRVFISSANAPANVTINGGTISGNRAIWVQLASDNAAVAPIVNVDINGGVLESTDETYYYAFYSYSYGNSFANVNVDISGGDFKGWVAFGGGYKGDIETVVISGGTYDSGVIRWNADGSYTLFDGMLADGLNAKWDGEKYVIVDHICEYVANVVAPTADQTGYTEYKCSCGDSYIADITAPTSGKVSGVAAAQVNKDGILEIKWTALNNVNKYIAYVYNANGERVKTAQTTATSIKFGGMAVGEYTVQVIAKVGDKWLDAAKADTVSAAIVAPSATPAAGEITKDSITITWDAINNATKYYVKVVGPNYTRVFTATGTSLEVSGLAVATEYTFSISAKLSTGKYTDYSAPVAIATNDYFDVVLSAEKQNDGTLKLSWTPENTSAVWVKYVDAQDTVTQKAVVKGASSVSVKDVAGDYYVIARMSVDGVNRYVTSNVVTVD